MRKTYKLTPEQREEAVQLYLETDKSLKEVAEEFGVSKQNITLLVRAKKRMIENETK
jgi:predicted DNA-binding protein YlxM (UPF0122 family)